jgi:hypothetical protein
VLPCVCAEQDIKKWLRTDFTHLHEPARHEGKLTLRSVSLGILAGRKLDRDRVKRMDVDLSSSCDGAKPRGNSTVVPFECSEKQEANIAAVLDDSTEWHWDIFALRDKCGGRELQVIIHSCMHACTRVCTCVRSPWVVRTHSLMNMYVCSLPTPLLVYECE